MGGWWEEGNAFEAEEEGEGGWMRERDKRRREILARARKRRNRG